MNIDSLKKIPAELNLNENNFSLAAGRLLLGEVVGTVPVKDVKILEINEAQILLVVYACTSGQATDQSDGVKRLFDFYEQYNIDPFSVLTGFEYNGEEHCVISMSLDGRVVLRSKDLYSDPFFIDKTSFLANYRSLVDGDLDAFYDYEPEARLLYSLCWLLEDLIKDQTINRTQVLVEITENLEELNSKLILNIGEYENSSIQNEIVSILDTEEVQVVNEVKNGEFVTQLRLVLDNLKQFLLEYYEDSDEDDENVDNDYLVDYLDGDAENGDDELETDSISVYTSKVILQKLAEIEQQQKQITNLLNKIAERLDTQ
jgi:hypothetical protein